ncbi:MAG: hypothetical protein ACPL3A_02705 [Thermoanaerobacteraceae bacterium]
MKNKIKYKGNLLKSIYKDNFYDYEDMLRENNKIILGNKSFLEYLDKKTEEFIFREIQEEDYLSE